MKIGACVSMVNGFKGAVEETLEIGGNTMMIYTGSPQSYTKKSVTQMKYKDGLSLLQQNGISLDDIVIHANYISNFASPEESKRETAMNALRVEINTAMAMKIKYIVIHPGSYTTGTGRGGVQFVAECLNTVLNKNDDVMLLIETMAGKGKEVCRDFEEVQSIMDNIILKDKVGVCWDTCHMNDAGYDFTNDMEDIITEFDGIVGLDKVRVIHLNNSINKVGSNKDRHSNIVDGTMSPEVLYNLTRHPLLKDKIWILESKEEEQYANEIAFFKNEKYDKDILE